MNNRTALLFLLPAMLFADPAMAQSAPTDCKPDDTRLQCIILRGTKSDARSQSGIGGDASGGTVRKPSNYSIFIHARKDQSDLIAKVKAELEKQGYVVRGVDSDQDLVGGPAVDYFRDEDRPGAAAIAAITNEQLPQELKRLELRRQRVANPSGFIGLWLPTVWWSSEPDEGWCVQQTVQREQQTSYLVRCYESEAMCREGRGNGQPQQSLCTKVSNLKATNWNPKPGGRLNSWYSFSEKAWAAPFPAFNAN